MNLLTARQQLQNARPLIALATLLLFTTVAAWAAEPPQSSRYLFIFETSPVVKKHLPDIQRILIKLFASNMQQEIHDDDDLAVWTVDEKLHRGIFPMLSWAPDEAAMYTARLYDFLGKQNYTRHATLDAMQPYLDEVVKTSDRLTIIIFCDSKSRLLGTPYDDSITGTITNAVAKTNGDPIPLILVLRSSRGEYVGSSVNVGSPLNFPAFPPPPKPAPAPVAKVERVQAPPPAASSVAPLIIVGTHVGTNIDAVTKMAAQSTSAPPPRQPAPGVAANNPTASSAPIATPVVSPALLASTTTSQTPTPAMVPAPLAAPAPAPAAALSPQPPVPAPAPQILSHPEPASATAPAAVVPISQPAVSTTNVVIAEAGGMPSGPASRWLLVAGGGALAVAGGLVVWLVMRSRRPASSLITSSMQNDPRTPPGN